MPPLHARALTLPFSPQIVSQTLIVGPMGNVTDYSELCGTEIGERGHTYHLDTSGCPGLQIEPKADCPTWYVYVLQNAKGSSVATGDYSCTNPPPTSFTHVFYDDTQPHLSPTPTPSGGPGAAGAPQITKSQHLLDVIISISFTGVVIIGAIITIMLRNRYRLGTEAAPPLLEDANTTL